MDGSGQSGALDLSPLHFFCHLSTISTRSFLVSFTSLLLFPLGRQQTMTDISDDQVDELLRQAEQRLKNGSAIVSSTTSNAVVAGDAATTKQLVKQQNSSSSSSSSKKDGLTVRAPPQPQLGLKAKEKVRKQTPAPKSIPFATCMKKIYPKPL